MKKKTILSACVAGVMGLLTSCSVKAQMPESELVSITYTRSGTMAGYEYEGHVTKTDSGVVAKAMRKNYSPLYQLKVDKKALADLRDIIREEKMYAYEPDYRPPFQIYDGYSWSFEAVFADGKSISSSGYHTSPAGNGLKRVRAYMEELVRSEKATMIEPDRYDY